MGTCFWTCGRYDYHGGCAEQKRHCTEEDSTPSTPSPDYGAIAYGRAKLGVWHFLPLGQSG